MRISDWSSDVCSSDLEKGVPSALHTLFDNYIADVFGAQATYRLHLDAIAQDMRADHAAARLLEVEQFADRVCAEANADRWDRARPDRSDERPEGNACVSTVGSRWAPYNSNKKN